MSTPVPTTVREAAIANLVSQVSPLAGDGTAEYPIDQDGTIRVRVVNLDRLLVAVLDAAAEHLYAFAKDAQRPAVYIAGSVSSEELQRGVLDLRRKSIEAAADELRITARADGGR
jgi:hypothetical protein